MSIHSIQQPIQSNAHANRLFDRQYAAECRRVSRFMIWLMAGQWLAGIAFAVFYSPFTWIGDSAMIHAHVVAAILLGTVLSGTSWIFLIRFPTATSTRHVVAVNQMLWSALLIHLSGGRIETHFHVFASLAILSLYRDWRILVTATVIVGIDHLVRGIWYPMSVFGVFTPSPFRWIEHVLWVSFAIAFLIPGCIRLRKELFHLCQTQMETEQAKRTVQQKVDERTAALRQATDRYELAIRGTAEGLWDWDLITNETFYAPRYKELLGYCDDDPEFQPVIDSFTSRLHPEDVPRTEEAIRAAVDERAPYRATFRLQNKSGEWRWFSASAAIQRDVKGRAIRMAGAITDITDEREAELELKAARASLEEAQTVARMANWSYDPASGAVQCSRQLYQLFDWDESAGPPKMQNLGDLFQPDDTRRLEAMVHRAIETGEPYSLVLQTRKQQHGVRFVRAVGRAKQNAEGRVISLFGTVTDVTQEVEREDALRVARDQAESASRAKSEFLANMSHEIRTPLTAILGYTELLGEELDSTEASPQRQRSIAAIHQAGGHLLTIINDMLDLSKIEADKMAIEYLETPLLKILCEVESLMRPRAVNKGIELNIEFLTAVPDHILCDPTRLRQILINLVGNAVKFTEGGKVTIQPSVVNQDGQSQWMIDVIDTGIGITSEQAEQLFTAFAQADTTMTRKHGGTGLGLTISRRLAGLLGGNVTLVDSTPGHGSRFRLELPLQPALDAEWVDRLDAVRMENLLKSPLTIMNRLQGRILLAEDGPDNQQLIAYQLRKAGAEVDIADNGRLALDMLEQAEASGQCYDLVVTDIQMPEMDGFTLASTIRARGNLIPIVALTAHAMPADRQACLDAGCNDYCVKPIDRPELIRTCHRWLITPLAKVGRNAWQPPGTETDLATPDSPVRVPSFDATPHPAEEQPVISQQDLNEPSCAADRTLDEPATSEKGKVRPTFQSDRTDRTTEKPGTSEGALVSELEGDAGLEPLIDQFVSHLADKLDRLNELLETERRDELAQLAHQLKGAGGGYGYPTISEAARQVERCAKSGRDVRQLHLAIDELAELCQQAIRGRQAAESHEQPSQLRTNRDLYEPVQRGEQQP